MIYPMASESVMMSIANVHIVNDGINLVSDIIFITRYESFDLGQGLLDGIEIR
jgi:hypothetical protein